MTEYREILFNYTSADDRQIVTLLLGEDTWSILEGLRERRRTGRSARLLMRLIGDLFVHQRNPFLYHELVTSSKRRSDLFGRADDDLRLIQSNTDDPDDVQAVVAACRKALELLRTRIAREQSRRSDLRRRLGKATAANNVSFAPFDIVSHITDATDWRLFPPVAVVRPANRKEIAELICTLRSSEYNVIVRGGGTGLTGGSVPLCDNCVIINTERLNRIHDIKMRTLTMEDGEPREVPMVTVEAGAITEDVMTFAAKQGLVFSADPTSAWASTIGGNIAENAGGKSAVRWGTTLDSLYSYRMVLPTGDKIKIRRCNHPMRKIMPEDTIVFEVISGDQVIETIKLSGLEIRRKGLWKDITNKVLGGLPGMQKEGTDGIITQGTFVLYPQYKCKRTVCLEFFGETMDEACEVIQKISEAFPPGEEEALVALEHFDDKYMEAIGYRVKADRNETPKAALLIDVVGHTTEQADKGIELIATALAQHQNTVLHVAADADEATLFWADRKKLGAIAARTNAFKLNEDIVLPIPALADFVRFLDKLNVTEDRHNLLTFLDLTSELLTNIKPTNGDDDLLKRKVAAARPSLQEAKKQLTKLSPDESAENLVNDTIKSLTQQFNGYPELQDSITQLFAEVRKRIIIIATHMHAGDGNVHVNIPVFSNDRDMMHRAEAAVDLVMDKTKELGGVVSGEHGIGITKLKYWEPERLKALKAYRKKKDPDGIMNVDKLENLDKLALVYTPSFNLLELEARILHYGGLGSLANKVAQCVRCGKCKPDCCVFYPQGKMFYHPRNKNLAIGSLIEALLYDAQNRQEVGFELLKHLEEIADHCTACHKCLKPCPVNIDTGDVSIFERELLAKRKFKHTSPVTRLTLEYLSSDSRLFNFLFRSSVLAIGSRVQAISSRLLRPIVHSGPLSKLYPMQLLDAPMPAVHSGTLHDDLPTLSNQQALVLHPAEETDKTVFYFPGCGSERMFSDVSRAAIFTLLKSGARVVVPPPYLCCGFPAHVNAKPEISQKSVLKDLILFSQIREMLKYYDFDACLVTCGTCKESLEHMGIRDIFGCDLMDSSAYLAIQNMKLANPLNALYHAPCHDSLDGKADKVLNQISSGTLTPVPHCCSEAGTLALSRPDIAASMRERKRCALIEGKDEANTGTLLTNCPSCLQGLGRNASTGVQTTHIAVALAEGLVGKHWKQEFRQLTSKAEIITL